MRILLSIRQAWNDLRHGTGTLEERAERNADVLLFVVLALALALRLCFLVAFHSELTTRVEKGFAFPAMNFASGHGMGIAADCPTSYRAPLYILFLIPFYALFGAAHYAWPLGLAQTAVGLASVYLVYLIGKEWRSKAVGLLGASFMAVYPYDLYHDTQFYITFLFTFFLLLTVLGFLRLERAPKTGTAVLNGLWIGLAMLATSGPMAFFAPLACAWLWRRWGSLKKALSYSAVMAATAFLVMTPWICRNFAVQHAFVPLTTDSGRVFYKAYNDDAIGMMLDGLWVDATPEPPDGPPSPMDGVRLSGCGFMRGYSETASSRFYGDLARAWVAKHPGTTALLAAMKFNLLWRPWMYPPKSAEGGTGTIVLSAAFMDWAYALSYGFLFLFAAFEALTETRAERGRTWLFLAAALAFTLTYVITVAGTKYRVPFDSLMAVLAAAGAWRFWRAWSGRNKGRP